MREGWEIKSLGEILQKTETIDPTKSPDKDFRYVDVSSVNNVDFFIENTSLIKGKEAPSRARKLIKERDVLFATVRPTLKRIAIVPNELNNHVCSTGYFVLRANTSINYKLLFYYLQTDAFTANMEKLQRGASYPAVTDGDVKDQIIEFPKSSSEQQRIVAILDDAFAAISKAKQNAERNLQNAKELFESYLNGVFGNKGDDWEEKELGTLAKVIGGYSFKSTDFKKDGKYQVLRMGNVRPGIIRNEESPVFIDHIDDNILKRALLKIGDVIITQTGTKSKRDYGFTVIIDQDNYLVNQRIAAIRFSDKYLSNFFLYYSWTKFFKDQFFENETGTVGQGNVGIGAVTGALIPFCSVKEQTRINDHIDTLSTETKKLESIYQKKIADLEELKKSILQKAFNGELITTDIAV
jgi:type I restriction enzyme S subunit